MYDGMNSGNLPCMRISARWSRFGDAFILHQSSPNSTAITAKSDKVLSGLATGAGMELFLPVDFVKPQPPCVASLPQDFPLVHVRRFYLTSESTVDRVARVGVLPVVASRSSLVVYTFPESTARMLDGAGSHETPDAGPAALPNRTALVSMTGPLSWTGRVRMSIRYTCSLGSF